MEKSCYFAFTQNLRESWWTWSDQHVWSLQRRSLSVRVPFGKFSNPQNILFCASPSFQPINGQTSLSICRSSWFGQSSTTLEHFLLLSSWGADLHDLKQFHCQLCPLRITWPQFWKHLYTSNINWDFIPICMTGGLWDCYILFHVWLSSLTFTCRLALKCNSTSNHFSHPHLPHGGLPPGHF